MTALLSHSNATPDSTLSLSVGSSSNLDNLKSFQVPAPFASITTATGAFTLSSTFTAQSVRVLALVMTDLQSSASIRLNVYNAGDPIYGEHVPFVVSEGTYIVDGLVYSVLTAQTGYISELEPVGGRSTILITLPETVTADEVRVFVEDAQAAVRVGALWAGPAFVADGIQAGWTISHEDFSLVSRVGATPWVNRRARVLNFAASFSPLTEAQAIGENGIQPLLATLGRSAPVLFVPSDRESRQRLAVYGLLSTPGSVSHIEAEWYRAEIDVAEIGG